MIELVSVILIVSSILLFWIKSKRKKEAPLVETPVKWKTFLLNNVNFYRNLKEEDRLRFGHDVQRFLASVRISGVQVEVELEDRLLVASSAIIPLFGFPAWNYKHLDEVILYPSSFDRNFEIGSREEIITGMVGNGAMEGKMILSKPSLHHGFGNAADKKNVGIHEFVHLFDKETGAIDGVPPGYDEQQYVLPWLDFISQKIGEIHDQSSDINSYGATNRQEFFAVASEYFFERPHLLKDKHPLLYEELSTIFNQEMTAVILKSSFSKSVAPKRNSPCPCGSGVKYKRCCLN